MNRTKDVKEFQTNQINELEKSLKTGNQDLNKIHDIILHSLEEEELITKKLKEAHHDQKISFPDRLSDKIAEFGGSRSFIIVFGLVMAIWMTANVILASKAFDPYPYILLNLCLSTVAALQAPVIMMSQNRKETKDRQRAENDYIVNLKSEIGIKMLNEKIDVLIIEEMGRLFAIQQEQLELLKKINK